MPCRTDVIEEDGTRRDLTTEEATVQHEKYLRERKQRESREEKWEKYRRENDPPGSFSQLMTPEYLLCEAMTLLEEHELLHGASTELLSWYKAHELDEINRVISEAQAKLPKELSKREKRLLQL